MNATSPYNLRQEPLPEWYYSRDTVVNYRGKEIKRKINIMYIEMVEHLFHSIFKDWRTEVVSSSMNGIYAMVHVRVTADGTSHDGVACVEIGDPNSFHGLQSPTTALPLAKTFAILDAAHMFGEIFGANINRVVHESIHNAKIADIDIAGCKSLKELEALFSTLSTFEQQDEAVKMAFAKRKVEIKHAK